MILNGAYLHNVSRTEPTNSGYSLFRFPKNVSDCLHGEAKTADKSCVDAEIRFRLVDDEVKITLNADLDRFGFSVYVGFEPTDLFEVLTTKDNIIKILFNKANIVESEKKVLFGNNIIRIVLHGECKILDIEGACEPPTEEVCGKVISFGARESVQNTYPSLKTSPVRKIAEGMEYDFFNLESEGETQITTELIEYIDSLRWDFAVLFISEKSNPDNEFDIIIRECIIRLAKGKINRKLYIIEPYGVESKRLRSMIRAAVRYFKLENVKSFEKLPIEF